MIPLGVLLKVGWCVVGAIAIYLGIFVLDEAEEVLDRKMEVMLRILSIMIFGVVLLAGYMVFFNRPFN